MKALIIVNGQDCVGIVHAVTGVLLQYSINIEDISQTIMDDSIFVMSMLVSGAALAEDFHTVSQAFSALSEKSGMNIRIQRTDVFHAMHNI